MIRFIILFFVLLAFAGVIAADDAAALPISDDITLPLVDWLISIIPPKYIAAITIYGTTIALSARMVTWIINRFWPGSQAATWAAYLMHVGEVAGFDLKKLLTNPTASK